MDAMRRRQRHERIETARSLRRQTSEPERRLWQQLRHLRAGASHFRRQAPVGPYFADFACHEYRIVVEVDGETHAAQDTALADESRDGYMRSQGYLVLRFWNNDVMNNLDGVMQNIQAAILERADRGPPPLTPPRASRGRETP